MKREDSSMNNNVYMDNSNVSENMNMAAMSVQTKKKSGNARRFLLLVILLICTVALLGGATYAWFTANTKVMVQEMQIQVTVAKGIQISADAQNWQASMTLADLYKAGGMNLTGDLAEGNGTEDAGSINQIPGLLYNISSLGNITSKSRLELFEGKASQMCWVWDDKTKKETGSFKDVGEGGSAGLEECDEATNPEFRVRDGLVESKLYEEQQTSCAGTQNYYEIDGLEGGDNGRGGNQFCNNKDQVIAFDMYLKLDQDARISLAENSFVQSATKENYGLQNTIRIAFVTLGTQPAKFYNGDNEEQSEDSGVLKDPTTFGGSALTGPEQDYKDAFGGYVGKYGARIMNIFGDITIWEPNANKHTKAAIDHARNNYNLTEDQVRNSYVTTNAIWAPITGNKKAFNLDYYDNTNPSSPVKKTKSVTDAPIMPLYMTDTNKTDYPQFFAPQKNVPDYNNENTAFDSTGSLKPYKNNVNLVTSNDKNPGKTQIFAAPKGVTKLRVYIWVEGSDIDTENNATSSTVNAQLFFTSADASGTTVEESEFIKYNDKKDAYGSESGNVNKNWRTGTPTTVKTPYKPATAGA